MDLGRVGLAVVEKWSSFTSMLAQTEKATLNLECFHSALEAGNDMNELRYAGARHHRPRSS